MEVAPAAGPRPVHPPTVAILILNWNGIADTERCLHSVFALDYPAYEVIVVDNASADDSLPRLRHLEPRIRVVESARNLGYAGGNNLGLSAIAARPFDYVWLLNNDTVVMPATLSRLVAGAEADPRIGIASPVIHDRDLHHAVQACGARVDRHRFEVEQTGDCDVARAWQEADPDRFIVYGTAPLIKAAVLRHCGGLNEGYFAYWEDIEFALRAIAGGYRCATIYDAAVDHRPLRQAGAIDRPPYYFYYAVRNHYLLWRAQVTPLARLRLVRCHLLRTLQFVCAGLQAGRADQVDACLAGAWAAWSGRTGPWDGHNPMPALVRVALTTAPAALRSLLAGDLRTVARALGRRLTIVRRPAG